MSDKITAYDDQALPILVAEENREQWQEVLKSNLGPRMKQALLRVAGGYSPQEAAKAEGYESPTATYDYAVRYGLVNLKTQRIVQQHRSIAKLANQEIERRLLEEPESIKDRDLIVAGGVASDKIFAHEKANTDEGRGYLSELEQVAKAFRESGAEIDITVKVRPAEDSVQGDSSESESPHPVIDVTPTPDEIRSKDISSDGVHTD